MIKLSRNSIRNFFGSPSLRVSQVKFKINELHNHDVLVGLSQKEQQREIEKKRQKLKELYKTPYNKQRALHAIKRSFPEKEDAKLIKQNDIGPRSEKDIDYLLATKDKRLIFTMLGTSGEQLRDSVLVARDVEKFLKRDQVLKAITLVRMAKTRGSGGLNAIITYYLKRKQSARSAIELYNWSRKWGIPIDEYTHTILFDGIGKLQDKVSKQIGDQVLKIFMGLNDKNEMNIINFNAAASALVNCKDPNLLLTLWSSDLKGIQRDRISYTLLLKGCKDVVEAFNPVVNSALYNIPSRFMDEQLLYQYIYTLYSRKTNKRILNTSILALDKYFDFNGHIQRIPRIRAKDLVLPELSHWGIENKFKLNKHIVALYLEICLLSCRYKFGINVFKGVELEQPELLDLDMYHKYMTMVRRKYPTNCIDKILEIYENVKTNPKFPKVLHTRLLVYKAFEYECLANSYKKNDLSTLNKKFDQLMTFMENEEGIYSEKFDFNFLPVLTWSSFTTCVGKLRYDKFASSKLEHLLTLMSRSIVTEQFDLETKKSPGYRKCVQLIEKKFIKILATFEKMLTQKQLTFKKADNLERWNDLSNNIAFIARYKKHIARYHNLLNLRIPDPERLKMSHSLIVKDSETFLKRFFPKNVKR